MATGKGLRDYSYPVKAGKWARIDIDGDYVQVLQATGDISLRFDDGDIITRRQGQGWPITYLRKVEILSVADQQVTLALGYTGVGGGPPYDNTSQFVGTVNVQANLPTLRGAPPHVVVAAGATVQVLPTDGTRLSATVQLDDEADGYVWIGDSSVDAGHGNKLNPDDIAEPAGSPEVWVFNPNPTDVTLFIGTESKP